MILADRVLETSTTTGTGNFTLAGAVAGYRAFSAVCATGDTFSYTIYGVDGSGVPTGEWEVGLGTYSGANTLTRTTVQSSSNANAAVNFSAGTKQVALTISAVAARRAEVTPVVTISTTAEDLDPAHDGAYIRFTNAAAKALTVEPNSTTAQPTAGEWTLRNVGAGDLTITAGSGVTINAPSGGSLVLGTRMTCTLKRVATDEFDLIGQTV